MKPLLKDMTNKFTHQYAFPVKTCNKFDFNFLRFWYLNFITKFEVIKFIFKKVMRKKCGALKDMTTTVY